MSIIIRQTITGTATVENFPTGREVVIQTDADLQLEFWNPSAGEFADPLSVSAPQAVMVCPSAKVRITTATSANVNVVLSTAVNADTVKTVSQVLTEDEKAIARQNIGMTDAGSALATAEDTAAQADLLRADLFSGHVTIGNLKGFRWLKKDGTTLSGASIMMDEDHDALGGELYISAPWRIAFLNYGPTQMGVNDEQRYPRYWFLTGGYASASHASWENKPSGALAFRAFVWNGSASIGSDTVFQSRHLDTSGTDTVLEVFANGTVGGRDGGGSTTDSGTGTATGTKVLEIYSEGVWSNGTAPAPSALADGATVTLTCSKYKTFQNHTLVLGGNRSLEISGAVAGMRGTILVEQDAVGSRTLALPANAGTKSGFALSTAPYSFDRIDWFFDGTYFWFEVSNDFQMPADSDAAAFLSAAGISETTTEGRAINKLTLQLKAAALWSKIHALYPFVGGSATPHSKDLKGSHNGSFGGAPTHDANGITGNVTNAYFDSGLAPSAVSAMDSLLIYTYCRTQTPTTGKYIFGATGTDNSRVGIYVSSSANVGLAGFSANTIGSSAASVGSDYRKHLGGYRGNSSTTGLLVGSSKITPVSVASISACDRTVTFLARNAATKDNFSDVNLAMAMIAQDFDSSEYAAFCVMVEEFQQALGRKI